MGMSIKEPFIAHSELTNEIYIVDAKGKYSVTDQVEKAVVATNRAIPKDQYEARLKADMVAMLTEIQLDIEKHTMTSGVTNQGTWNECIACCSRVIQQKINKLKESTDGKA